MASQWKYFVMPKLWDNAKMFTYELNFYQMEMGMEFVGIVELEGYEHHVWRMPFTSGLQYLNWSQIIAHLTVVAGKPIGKEGKNWLERLEKNSESLE